MSRGCFKSFYYSFFGDRIKGDALDICLFRKDRSDVPGDGLSFAVRVGGEIDDIAVFGGFF